MHPDFLIDRHHKSFPLAASPVQASRIAERGWNVLADDLPYPLAVIRRSALEHNVRWMQDYAQGRRVAFAPHGKTTMSPQLFDLQLRGGAWGLTFATIHQLAVGLEAGMRRAIIANQVVAPADLDGLDALLTRHEGLRVWFLVDSLAQLRGIEDWARGRGGRRVFDVLLEVGIPGQRTGVRTSAEALELARAIQASPAARLGGIECYEGGLTKCDSAHDVPAVTELVRRVVEIVAACDAQGLLPADEPILSAGGSAIFDLVMPLLQGAGLARPFLGVLRSGCYVTHDHGNYQRLLKLVEQRGGLQDSLQAALEVWAMVQSVPEPGLALLTCGRRDISYDLELPSVQRWAPRGARQAQDAPASWKISALNDQHAYLRFDPSQAVPAVGDRVALGISHPCTTFDKWRWMPVVDDAWTIVDAVETRF
ncbi:amino acid deaminase [Castellaniella hirudinis]|uniref:Amino acid deaminase n=1 Tax=Castellaniella hirudinis TaxID=1144617 RepID=A0ABV8S0N6_9BURK